MNLELFGWLVSMIDGKNRECPYGQLKAELDRLAAEVVKHNDERLRIVDAKDKAEAEYEAENAEQAKAIAEIVREARRMQNCIDTEETLTDDELRATLVLASKNFNLLMTLAHKGHAASSGFSFDAPASRTNPTNQR